MKKIIYGVLALTNILAFTSCDDYLDKMPDNRAFLDTPDKITSLVTTAYPNVSLALVGELMSDNVDNYGENNPNTDKFADQCYGWKEITETSNESPEDAWDDAYNRINTANEALQAIEDLGGATSDQLKAAKAEALLCRAYNHFMMVSYFCKEYNPSTNDTEMGVPYVTEPVTTVDVSYERGTVGNVYKHIEADIQEALPLMSDAYYTVPKYHFNKKAAYAFASRFYLFTNRPDSVIKYADKCLGAAPATMLRDWKDIAAMTQEYSAVTQHYIDASLNCNLLLTPVYSFLSYAFGPYSTYSKYSHGRYLAYNEDANATNVWSSNSSDYYSGIKVYSATNLDKSIFWKLPGLFEYTDAVAGIGYFHTVIPVFTCDEVLLNRAEAYVLKGEYEKAVSDLNIWRANILSNNKVLTVDGIVNFYNKVNYCYSDEAGIESTVKKHLHPYFEIGEEGGTKECMLQCVLGIRRIETLQTGLRWLDIKRYGIEIVRREMGANGSPAKKLDYLAKDDLRRQVQIPSKVVQAGIPANPR